MEDIRSNPEEESLESPKAREEMETLDEATHEAEAHIEKTRDYTGAEVVEGMVKDMVKGSPEAIDPTKSPGASAAGIEKIGEPDDDEDEATPINLPDTQNVHIAASPLPIPKDDPIDIPIPLPKEADEVGAEAASVSMDGPDPDPDPPDVESTLAQEEAIVGRAPTEMPPEMDKSKSDELVGMKFHPVEEETAKFKGEPAMVKGDAGMEPDPPDPDPDIRSDEVVGMKFHPADEASIPGSPDIDQVSKIEEDIPDPPDVEELQQLDESEASSD